MADPLVMLGPGGDFITRYDVKGHDLLRNVGQSLGQQPDTESNSSFAGYSRMPRRGSAGAVASSRTLPAGPISRGSDVFEHAAPRVTLRLYSPQPINTPGHRASGVPGAGVNSDSVLASIITSIESWLAAQHVLLLVVDVQNIQLPGVVGKVLFPRLQQPPQHGCAKGIEEKN